MNKVEKLLQVSFIKTVRFNIHYLGWKSALRPIFWVGKNVRIANLGGEIIVGSKIIGAIKIGLGYNGVIDSKGNRTSWENMGTIIFSGTAHIQSGAKIVNHGILEFGNDSSLNGNASVICYKKIKIGDKCFISWDTQIMDTDFHKILDVTSKTQINPDKEVLIGNHVWIGSKSMILKGSAIPDNCIIAANSIVTKKLQETNAVYVSNRVERRNVEWRS